MSPPRLFTYGTLMPGGRNHAVLAGLGGTWRTASMPGRLVWKGDPVAGYPGLVPGGPGVVEGNLLEADLLAGLWADLDRFEGPEYIRRLALCDAGGEALAAQVYVLRDPESFGR